MLKSIGNSYSGILAHQQMLDVTAHNLANLNTTAFKEKQVSFQDFIYRELAERRLPRAGNPAVGPRSGRGTALSGTISLWDQGTLTGTGRHLDFSITGEGFFRVVRPDGSYAYTRSGNFSLDSEGNLVMPDGSRLDAALDMEEMGERVDLDTLAVSPGGVVTAALLEHAADEDEEAELLPLPGDEDEEGEAGLPGGTVELGQVYLYRFVNPEGLYHAGGNVVVESPSSGPPQEGVPGEEDFGEIRQGFLENSNVDMARQMTELIRGQRALQASARSMTAADELWAVTLNLQA